MTSLERRAVLRAAASAAAVGALASGCGASRTEPTAARAAGSPTHDPRAPTSTPPGSPPGSPSGLSPGPPPVARPPTRAPGRPAQIDHGPRSAAAVALTFHGAGDPALADALLSEAERAGARLTVLAVGEWLDEHPRIASRVLDGGHDLGNHTRRHLDISSMREREAYEEIEGCTRGLRRLTGSIGSWFRPSRTRYATDLVVRAARRAGYPHVLSYDVADDPGAAAIRRTVRERVRPGSIVSLHLGRPGTLAALPSILDDLHRRGLRAVTTTELVT